jgi:hypothetical protein
MVSSQQVRAVILLGVVDESPTTVPVATDGHRDDGTDDVAVFIHDLPTIGRSTNDIQVTGGRFLDRMAEAFKIMVDVGEPEAKI